MTNQKNVTEQTNSSKPILTLTGRQAKAASKGLQASMTKDEETGEITRVDFYLEGEGLEQATEQFTDDVWLYSNIPKGKERIDIPVNMILPKRYYERFMHIICNDPELFREITSTLMCDKLKQWAGKSCGEPEIVAQIAEAALNKHRPLKDEKQEA